MQQPSPALSSPSTGFFGPRASPLFTQSVDQLDPPLPGDASSAAPLSAVLSSSTENGQQAPPKQLALAMEGLAHALRLIAEIRLGSDILLEALERATSLKAAQPPAAAAASVKKASDFVVRTEDAIAASMEALRTTGRKLEALGVLSGAQQRFEEKHPWGLQVPLICSDGAIVAYSWKRQIAGQAAASAVERTRLALKAFTEQKKRFFPRFGDTSEEGADAVVALPAYKRARIASMDANMPEQAKADQSSQGLLLLDLLKSWQTEVPGVTIAAFTRLEWVKHKSSTTHQKSNVSSGPVASGLDKPASALKPGLDASSIEKVAILEVTVPAVFKAVVSLFPSGSTIPDAVSVFSADEVCSNAHLGGTSSHAVFRRVSECATSALHSFLQSARPSAASALNLLLHWLCTYRSLFSKPCSQCKRVLALDRPSDLLLPPVIRPFHQVLNVSPSLRLIKVEDLNDEKVLAYHLSCTPTEESTSS